MDKQLDREKDNDNIEGLEIAESLAGILKDDITLEEAREERLSRI